MRKLDTLQHAAKVIALCLPGVVMSLIGLAALPRKKGAALVGSMVGVCTAARRTGAA